MKRLCTANAWLGLLLIVGTLPSCTSDAPAAGYVTTVNGPIAPEQMGTTLAHEHVLVDFAGVGLVSPDRYDREEVFQTVLPHLERVRSLGLQTLIEATLAYLGRDPLLLKQLADASGGLLLVSTAYYGALGNQHLSLFAVTEPAGSLAALWIREWTTRIDGTGIRPGFIKIGVDAGPLSDIHRKLIQAAARTHLSTGLTIAAHTGPATAALGQLAVLEEEGVHRSAWIGVHAQAEEDSTFVIGAARSGAWISFDGLGPGNVERYVELLALMKSESLLHRVLVSHDAGWHYVGEPGGGTFRPYDTLFTDLLPAREAAGFTGEEIHQLTVVNPAEAFTVRVRARS